MVREVLECKRVRSVRIAGQKPHEPRIQQSYTESDFEMSGENSGYLSFETLNLGCGGIGHGRGGPACLGIVAIHLEVGVVIIESGGIDPQSLVEECRLQAEFKTPQELWLEFLA